MSQPQAVIDGALQSGTFQLTFDNGCVATTENFSFNTETTTAEDRTATGAPQRTKITAGWATGTCVIQLPGTIAATNRPKFGSTFTVTGAQTDPNYTDMLFYVSEPPAFEADNDPSTIRKATINFRICKSGTITTSGTY